MNLVLFADAWVNLIPIVVVVIYTVAHLLRQFDGNAQQKRGQQQQGRPADPQKELEKFLQEIANKRQQEQPMVKAQPAKNPPKKPPKAKKPQLEAEPVHRASVQERHLVSDLEKRQARTIHSEIESTHIKSHVAEKSVGSADLQTAPVTTDPQVAVRREAGDPALRRILTNPALLSRSLILGEVLQPPISLR